MRLNMLCIACWQVRVAVVAFADEAEVIFDLDQYRERMQASELFDVNARACAGVRYSTYCHFENF